MEYTKQNYEEDKKISNYVFNKYFKNNFRFREDMIQESLIKLWQGRQKFDETKGQYSIWAFKVSANSMRMFLRFVKKSANDFSLDYRLEIGQDNDLVQAIDLIGFEEIDTDKIDFKDKVSNVLKNKEQNFKKVIDLFSQGYSQRDIAKMVDKAQPTISRTLEKFKNEFVKER